MAHTAGTQAPMFERGILANIPGRTFVALDIQHMDLHDILPAIYLTRILTERRLGSHCN